MTVLICGAGISGLTLGLSLHQIGVPFRIIEAIAELRPLGFGINLQPHAVRELYDLGLEAGLDAAGIPTAEIAYFNAKGQKIWDEPRGIAAGYAWPQYSIHRGALQMLLHNTLLKRCGPKAILGGAKVSEWYETPHGIEVVLTDHAVGAELGRERGSVLVACDGVQSTIRSTIFPEQGQANLRRSMMWRGLVRGKRFLDGRTMTISGAKGAKFVAYPVADSGKEGSLINWIADIDKPMDRDFTRQDWSRRGKVSDVLPTFADWHFDWLDIPELIASTEAVWEYPMLDRDPLPRWTDGRIALMGDSAHAMYPIGSNGASQGILDARVLARELRDHGETPEALVAYEEVRRDPVNEIILANRQQGPDVVLDAVAELAPDGFDDIDAVLPEAERRELAERYKQATGLGVEEINAKPAILGPVGH
ncbi:flavin-dependent oxidoreductase [Tropicimonas sp. IMCC34043]|uniref:flavin-dependent oxidoreductase n=1 Tax=Tropicimonas sp. IMCC34043 TaxID=2248760 RepID=UPI000E23AE69|nr:flavin-dependent oxidoreductase [Tropicimonas sp. IMCC34043]